MRNPDNSFFEDVYDVVRQIPKGRVTTYGAIARYLGTGMSARLVGWAMNASHGKNVPAQRVVNRNGLLTGKHHFPPGSSMKKLLEMDGLTVKKDQVQKFEEVFWNPEELSKGQY